MLPTDVSNSEFLSIPYATKQRNMHRSYTLLNATGASNMATEPLIANERRNAAIAPQKPTKPATARPENTLAVNATAIIRLSLNARTG